MRNTAARTGFQLTASTDNYVIEVKSIESLIDKFIDTYSPHLTNSGAVQQLKEELKNL